MAEDLTAYTELLPSYRRVEGAGTTKRYMPCLLFNEILGTMGVTVKRLYSSGSGRLFRMGTSSGDRMTMDNALEGRYIIHAHHGSSCVGCSDRLQDRLYLACLVMQGQPRHGKPNRSMSIVSEI